MNNLTEQTLAQIVTGHFRTAAVLEKYQLDFCCKGRRTLRQACEEKQLNLAEVLSELDNASLLPEPEGIQPDQLTLTALSEEIVNRHHEYVRKEMPVINGYLEKIAAKHGGRHPEMIHVTQIFKALTEEMNLHMQKEEKVLFPRIKEIEAVRNNGMEAAVQPTYLKAPVVVMEQEHDHAGSAMAEIRQLTSNYTLPADACTTYQLSFAALQAFEQDLHRHVHLENNVLFPKAMELFQTPSPASLN